MTDITMPALTDGMEQGTIIAWLVEDGAPVTNGQDLFEVETDKATVTVSAEADGVLQILAPTGMTVAVGEVLGRIGAEAGSRSEPGPQSQPESEPGPPPAREPVAVAAPAAGAPAPEAPAAGSPAPTPGAEAPAPGNGVAATPLARRIALIHEIALDTITGTGPHGRVTKRDVLAAGGTDPDPIAPAPAAVAPAILAGPPVPPVPEGATLQPLTRTQEIVARRMGEQALVPVFQVQTDVELDAALAFRAQLKEAAADGTVPSVNDLIVKACALALRDHPLVNGAYRPDGLIIHTNINVGIAVAADAGLLVATIRDADGKSLGEIARDARTLATRAREGTATPADLGGGTFTVSNLGMFGMTEITAMINPPQAAILGVGTGRPVLRLAEDGTVAQRTVAALNLTCDHRILNGADGARFLQDVKALLEKPLLLAL